MMKTENRLINHNLGTIFIPIIKNYWTTLFEQVIGLNIEQLIL